MGGRRVRTWEATDEPSESLVSSDQSTTSADRPGVEESASLATKEGSWRRAGG